jgi:hypothetical protein
VELSGPRWQAPFSGMGKNQHPIESNCCFVYMKASWFCLVTTLKDVILLPFPH